MKYQGHNTLSLPYLQMNCNYGKITQPGTSQALYTRTRQSTRTLAHTKQNQDKLTKTKTQYLTWRHQHSYQPITIHNTNIAYTDTYTYLGITLDSRLKQHQHYANVIQKAKKTNPNIISIITLLKPLHVKKKKKLHSYTKHNSTHCHLRLPCHGLLTHH